MKIPQPTRFDVVAFGELVIDLIPAGAQGGDALYAARPGGAPGNVAAGVGQFGLRVAMLSKVGRDPFGDLVVDALAAAGVDTEAVRRATVERTALAAVALDPYGDREFALYRANCADASYGIEEVDTAVVRDSRLLHVGSLALGPPASAAAQRHAIATARKAGRLVSADPNLRASVWADQPAMIAAGREAVACADIVKLSVDELLLLSSKDEVAMGVRQLWHPNLKVMAVTNGAAGAAIHTTDGSVAIDGYNVTAVDTVGCGDAFMASLVTSLLAEEPLRLDGATLAEAGRRACAAGAIVATRPGAMGRMPVLAEIERMMINGSVEVT